MFEILRFTHCAQIPSNISGFIPMKRLVSNFGGHGTATAKYRSDGSRVNPCVVNGLTRLVKLEA